MKKYINYVCICAWLLLLGTSCQEQESTSGKSGILISLVEETQIGVETRAISIGNQSFQKASLTVTNQDTQKKYTEELTSSTTHVDMPAGTYRVDVSLGENAELGLEPYYEGQKSNVEVMSNQGDTPVTITCALANALLSVKFGDSTEAQARFEKFFSNYWITVSNGNSSINIEKEDADSKVYFKADTQHPTVTFHATLKEAINGKDAYSYTIPAEYISTQAKDHTILTLAVGAMEAGLALEVVKAEIKEETIASTIPMEWLPKPQVSATGFDENNTLAVIETTTASASIDLTLPSALQEMKFMFDFDDEHLGLVKTQEYKLSTDKAQLEEALGIALPTIGTNSYDTKIQLDQLTEKLQTNKGATTNNTFRVSIQSNNRWSNECSYTLKCEKPIFNVSVYPGNIWTKEFTVNALTEADVQSGNFEKLNGDMRYQYSTDQTTWNAMESLTANELTPGTKYYVRGMYRGEVPSSDNLELKTYEAYQIPNSTFEDGYTSTFPKSNNPLYIFNGEWIDTRNALTCHDTGVNAFYVSKSSTLPIQDNNNHIVAHMMTIGWGENNTCAFGRKTGSMIHNISAGLICVGKYEVLTGKISAKEAYIRPTAMQFVYKAIPYNDDEYIIQIEVLNITNETETIIGKGELQSNAKQDIYTTKTLIINYDKQYNLIPISHIRIRFQCGTKEDKDHLNSKFEDAKLPYTYAYLKGSELWLDEFSLIYDK